MDTSQNLYASEGKITCKDACFPKATGNPMGHPITVNMGTMQPMTLRRV